MGGVTSRDVASRAGVSQSTVSFVLNNSQKASISEETRNRVLRAAQELGYVHKPSEKRSFRGLKNVIAVVVPNLFAFYTRLIDCIEKHAVSRGYSILLCNIDSRENEEYYIDLFMNRAVRGVVFAFTPNTNNIIDAIEGKVPAVLLGEKDEEIRLDTICLNSMAAGNMLIEHLYELGHRNIGFVSSPSEAVSRATRRRLEGVQVKMEQLGLKNRLYCAFDENYKDNFSFRELVQSGRYLTNKILNQHPDITALVAPDDMICIGIMNALKERGLTVPDDIALCTFDDTDISHIVTPNITTVDHGTSIRVKFAIDLLIDRINNPNKSGLRYKTESEPNLVVRGSTVKGQ